MVKDSPTPPSEKVTEKMDPAHTEADFLADLDRATKRLADPSERGRGSPMVCA